MKKKIRIRPKSPVSSSKLAETSRGGNDEGRYQGGSLASSGSRTTQQSGMQRGTGGPSRDGTMARDAYWKVYD